MPTCRNDGRYDISRADGPASAPNCIKDHPPKFSGPEQLHPLVGFSPVFDLVEVNVRVEQLQSCINVNLEFFPVPKLPFKRGDLCREFTTALAQS